VILDMLKVKAC